MADLRGCQLGGVVLSQWLTTSAQLPAGEDAPTVEDGVGFEVQPGVTESVVTWAEMTSPEDEEGDRTVHLIIPVSSLGKSFDLLVSDHTCLCACIDL
ncbi:hypothetical protein KIPB_011005 [Kipferlia bialata]|uniref:Uncharacterized protein n=1 Tax=Kipferlia bialata TaxID=797122 RepID=A0A391NSI8_9EUKA|nr:hypothetical protein KIPB_011005 [Kipferlia bialata]|eukprot:g11005.t1